MSTTPAPGPRAVKAAARERDGGRCVYCGMTCAEHLARYGRRLCVRRLAPGSRWTLRGCVTVCLPCLAVSAKKGPRR